MRAPDSRQTVGAHRLFIRGGNWISPDVAWRYSASRQRYEDEIRYHADAGLNLIRVRGRANVKDGSRRRRGYDVDCLRVVAAA